MDLQTQKLNLIEEVLHLESSELVEQVANFLAKLRRPTPTDPLADLPPMSSRSAEEVADRLAQARADIQAGRTYSTEEVLARIQQGRAA